MKYILAMSLKHIIPKFLITLLLVAGFHIAHAQPYIVLEDDVYEIEEGVPLEMQLFENDTIWATDTIIWTLITEPNFGTVTTDESTPIPPAMPPFLPTDPVWVPNQSDVIFTYELDEEQPTDSPDMFTYSVCDKWMSDCDTATVLVYLMIHGVDPAPPQAMPDAAITLEGTLVEIDVLLNDFDTNAPPSILTLKEVDQPENGLVSIENSKIAYVPADDYVGTEQFSYIIENEFGLTSTTWVTVVVGTPTTTSIDAVDDVYHIEMSGSQPYLGLSLYNIGGFVLDNFGITENDAFNPTTTIRFCSEAQNGTIGIGGTDDVPQSGFFAEYIPHTPGTEILCYELCDDFLDECDQATITINITINPNDPVYPIANDDYYESPVPEPIVMNVTENDAYITNAALTVTIVEAPSFGTAEVMTAGLIVYTPNPDLMGEDTFVYSLCDVTTGICSQATVTAVIADEPFPDEVIAVDDFVTYLFNASIVIDPLENDWGVDLQLVEVHNALHGSVVLNLDQTITYSLVTANAPSEDYFNYVVCGGPDPDNVQCDTATVYVDMNIGENQAPIAQFDMAYTKQGIPVTVNVLANDSDPDGSHADLMVQPLISEYPEGIVNVLPDQSISFHPNEDFTGEFVISYMICDSGEPQACSEAELIIYVIDNVDGSLKAFDDFFVWDDSAIAGLHLTVLNNDVTTENTEMTVFGLPKHGQLFWGINPEEPPFYMADDPNYQGQDSLFYIICDQTIGDCDVGMIYINLSGNPAIDAVDDYAATPVNTATTIQVFSNDIFSINTYTLQNVGNPSHGTIAVAESLPEQISYMPNDGFEGQDQFTYTICDVTTGDCDMATVYVKVGMGLEAVDDYIAIEFYGANDIYVQGNDINANNAVIMNFTTPEFGTVYCNPAAIPCMLVYEPAENFEGTDSFDYVICDLLADICDTATVYLTVGVDCSMGCVWPGDANNDGTANNFDILAVGLGFGDAGPVRPNASNNWYPQPSTDWTQEITTFTTNDGGISFDSITVNSKYADCNGNGVIEGTDIDAISQNYGLTHAKNGEKQAAEDAPAISFSLPEQIPANTWIAVDVLLGSEEQAAEDVYGVAFTINYDSDVVEAGSVSVDFDANSWFDNGDNISLYKDFGEQGQIDIGYSRTDGQSISGYGKIATFSIFVIDNVAGKKSSSVEIPFNISASKALMVNNEGFTQVLNTEPAESVVTDIDEIDLSSMNFYPNPSNNEVHFDFGVLKMQKLQIFNAVGQLMYEQSFEGYLPAKSTTLEVKNWDSGLYLVHFQTSDGVAARRLQVLK